MPTLLSRQDLTRRSVITIIMLLAIMVICFIYLLVRNYGLYLSVPDEWEYSESARLLPLRAVEFPSYLYFWIFRATNFCGSGFLDCARLINSAFYVCAIPFLYMVTRQISTRPVAFFVTLLSIFGPINTYTAYFMPESLYFLLFWILSWCALRPSAEARPHMQGGALGIVVGLMGLVKVHAIFLYPTIIAFLIFRYFLSEINSKARKTAIALTAFLCVALLVRFGLGYLFAGRAGLNLFGAFYGSIASSAVDSKHYMHLALLAGSSLEGHAMALASLFAMPLAALFYIRLKGVAPGTTDAASRDIRLFAFFVLACLLPVTAFFTASAAGSNAVETIARMHMRYYNFSLPLLLIIAAEQLRQAPRPGVLYRTFLPALVFGTLSILAIKNLLLSYTPGIVDSPELRGLTFNSTIFCGVVAAGLLSLFVWVYTNRFGAKIFLFFTYPLFIIFSGYYANVELRHQMVADSYAEAGIFTKQFIGRSQVPMIVVGADQSSLYRTLFYLDNANASAVEVPDGGRIDKSSISAKARWLLVIGDQVLPKSAREMVSFDGFVLARVGSEEVQELDFTVGSWPGIVAKKHGLSNPEPWGTWSDGNRVVLEFSKPLPKEFTLVLKGQTIGNTNQASTMVVGEERREIRLPSPGELALPFRTDGNVKSISIEIPWARSMREIGVSQDPRRLGIGFVSIRIIAKVPAATP